MKKMLFFAMAAAGMLTACSSDDTLDATSQVLPELSQEKIQLGVASSSAVVRGSGTIGSMEDATNEWAGQEFWVYMLNKGTMKVAKYADPEGTESDVYNNMQFTAPSSTASGLASTTNGEICYYPVSGNYDFWGYVVDDAAGQRGQQPTVKMLDATGQTTTDENEAVKRVVDINIDGTQDIMAGKAEPTADDIRNLGTRSGDYFSAYAARKSVQPNIKFNHLLTRFTFKVKAGNKATAGNGQNTEAMTVQSIRLASLTQGHLTIAHTEDMAVTDLLKFDGTAATVDEYGVATLNDATNLVVKQRAAGSTANDPLVGIDPDDPVILTWDDAENKGVEHQIGEALLVAPGETVYPLTIDLQQKVQTNTGGSTTTPKPLQFKHNLTMGNGMKFEAGKSYEIVITVYGLEKIDVTATLVPWQDGGKIDIDDDRDPQSQFTGGSSN